MQKSKYISICILVFMLIYFLFSQFYLKSLGNTYTYIINVIFFIVMALIVKFTIIVPDKNLKNRKKILYYVFIAVLIYALIYLLSGIFLRYGKNPYSQSIKGILLNLYSTGLVIFCREYIRYKIVNNVFKSDRKLIMILAVIVFSVQDIDIRLIISAGTAYYIFKTIFATIVPTIIKNSLFTYIETYTDFIPAVIYELVLCLIKWIPSILPNTPWIFDSMLDMMVPLILLSYCIYEARSKDKLYIYKKKNNLKPKGLIPITIITITGIWFMIGIFPIKPIGIISGSMSPNINRGDMVIVQKSTINDVEVDDIIEYKRDNKSIVHRIIKKYDVNGKTYVITKGDNNDSQDSGAVTEDEVQAKIIFKIPYVAWPMVWLNILK